MKRATIGAAVSTLTLLTLYGTSRDNMESTEHRTTISSSVTGPADDSIEDGVTSQGGVTLIPPLVIVCRGLEEPHPIVPTVVVDCPERN